jgi:hypothetical protein
MRINLQKGKVKCHERKNIGTLSQVKRKLSNNENTAASAASGVVVWPKSCGMFYRSGWVSEFSDILGGEGT